MKQKEFRGIKKKTIGLATKCRLFNIFPGEWASIYRGEGVEFVDAKPFELGDDLKNIDPRTFGLKDEMRIIQRMAEKELKVYVWADYSGSMQKFPEMLFPRKSLIRDIAVGLIIFSADKIYSPIGFHPFGLAKNKFFWPRRGEGYCWEIINWITNQENLNFHTSSGVEQSLASLLQLAQPRNLVFFISDFKQKFFDGDFTDILKKTVSKFDFIPVVIQDPLEKSVKLNFSTRIKVRSSSEKSKAEEIYLTPAILRKMQEVSREHILNLERNFKRLNIEHLVLDSASIDDCCRTFSNFFQVRKKTSR